MSKALSLVLLCSGNWKSVIRTAILASLTGSLALAQTAPTLTSLSPASVPAGAAATITLNGTNLVSGTNVIVSGNIVSNSLCFSASCPITYVSNTQMTVLLSATTLASPGTMSIRVSNSAGTSNTQTLTVTAGGGSTSNPPPPSAQGNRRPVINWMLPLNTTAGGPGSTLTVYGANFVQGSTVQWNGANRPTTFVNSNQLQVSVTAADIAAPGQPAVTVVTPAPGGGTSEGWAYAVISPGITTFAAGPQPVGKAPVAAAVDPVLGRIYVVHRGVFRDLCLNNPTDCPSWPTDVVTVVDQRSGDVLTTIAVGGSINGEGQGIAADSTRHRVYVTNAGDNTVTVIDGNTNVTLATTTVDKAPEGIDVDPDTGVVYAAAANVTLLDATTGAALASIPVGGNAWAVAVDRTAHLAYVLVNSVPQTVVVVDGAARSVRAKVTLPALIYTYSGLAVDPGSRVYACDYNSGQVTSVDISGSTPALLNTFSSGAQYAEAMAVDSASHSIYVVSSSAGAVNVLSSSGVKQKTINVLQLPTAITIDQSSRHAYVVDAGSDSLSVLDTTQTAITGAIPLGVQAMGLAFDPASGLLYGANFVADAVSVINPGRQAVTGNWSSMGGTWSVGVDSALHQVYAVNSRDGSVNIFSAIDGSLKATVSTGATGASVAAINPVTNLVYVSSGTLGGSVTVINGKTNQSVARIATGDTPTGIAIDETLNRIYVANQHSGTISVIDGGSNQTVATWHPRLSNVWKLAVDPALKRLYASIPPPTLGSFTGLEVLDSSTGAFVAQIAASSSAAEDVAVNRTTHHVFLADAGNGTVSVIDGLTNTVLKSLVTGTSAVALAVDAASGQVFVSNPFDPTIAVFSDQANIPVITPGGVVSAGSGNAAAVTPGGIVALYGANLASLTAIADGASWPATLANVSVLVNGVPAPVYFVSAGQIDFEIPWQFLGQSQVSVVVVVNAVSSPAQTVRLAASGPDIFVMNTQGQGAVQIANTVILAAPANSIPGAQTRPAARGDYITIYCTGLGDVTNRPASGAPASANPLSQTPTFPLVRIGGVEAPVIFSGLAPGYVGLYVVNAQVPASAPQGAVVPLVMSMGGAQSNTVNIAVQ